MRVYRQEGKGVCSSLGPHPISSSYTVCAHSHPSPIPPMLDLLGISQASLESFFRLCKFVDEELYKKEVVLILIKTTSFSVWNKSNFTKNKNQ